MADTSKTYIDNAFILALMGNMPHMKMPERWSLPLRRPAKAMLMGYEVIPADPIKMYRYELTSSFVPRIEHKIVTK